MSRGFRCLLSAVFVLAAVAVVPAGASAAPSISGTIKGLESGAGVAGAKACANPRFSAETICSGLTGSDGKYEIDDLFDGEEYEVYFVPGPGTGYLFQVYKERDLFPAEPEYVEAQAGDVPNIDAKLKKGGTIEGHVTDAANDLGIDEAEVCVSKFPNGNESCFEVGVGGNYTSPALTPGQYTVAFLGSGDSAYLRIYYDQETNPEDADPITLTAGVTKTGVDAALTKGSSIAGTVTDAGSAAELEEIEVCLYDAVTGDYFTECKLTNSFGAYKFGALPLGQYKVGFSEEPDPSLKDGYDTQYYEGAATFGEAFAIQFIEPEDLNEVDAHLHKTGSGETENPPPSNGGSNGGGNAQTLPGPSNPTPKVLKCKKGFKKKKVKGKPRCVKKKKKKRK